MALVPPGPVVIVGDETSVAVAAAFAAERPGAVAAIIEAGVLTRYEITRRVAPYVAGMFERRLGESARLAQAAGENPGGWSLRTGVRFWL
jgi:uncharacterized protein involved in copper resistance